MLVLPWKDLVLGILIQVRHLKRWPLFDINVYSGFLEKLSEGVVAVLAEADKALDAGVDQHLGAQNTGRMRAVDGSAFKTDTVQAGLDNDVLLGMNGAAYLVARPGRNVKLVPETAKLKTVLQPGGGAVVPG